jgi:hypothetical protein
LAQESRSGPAVAMRQPGSAPSFIAILNLYFRYSLHMSSNNSLKDNSIFSELYTLLALSSLNRLSISVNSSVNSSVSLNLTDIFSSTSTDILCHLALHT